MSGHRTTVDELLVRYDRFFLDAYGVLVATGGALPGAAAFLKRLNEAKKPWVLLSNDASRLPTTAAARYLGFGLPIRPEDIVTSGSLLVPYFASEGLTGRACVVLGTEDSRSYVRAAGGRIVDFDDALVDVVVAADDAGFPFLEGIERVITNLFRRLDAGAQVRLVLPNPDMIYPQGEDRFGLTAGSVAILIEGALRVRYGMSSPRFVGLGKPHRRLYEAAMLHTGAQGTERVVMLGDQLYTDILGANRFGIDSVLVRSGLTSRTARIPPECEPTWILEGLT